MKQVILSIILLTVVCLTVAAQSDSTAINASVADAVKVESTSVAQRTAEIYNNGEFRAVIEVLEEEKEEQLSKGLESSELYYNLGNAYFRVNDIAHARLYYERALLLDPGDRDIRHNIEYVKTKIEDKIIVADTFFLNIWFRSIQSLFNSNTWAITAIVSFLLLVACLVLFFFGRTVVVKKAAFYAGIVLLVVVVLSNVFAYNQKNSVENRDTAVIMAGSASVHSSPDSNSKEIFILHSGTKVNITKEDRSWIEIEIDNGSIGWIQRDKLEII